MNNMTKLFKFQFICGVISMIVSTVFLFINPILAGCLFSLGVGNALFGSLFYSLAEGP